MDAIDCKLLDVMQAGIPLVERPYRALGAGLGLTEREVLGRVARLKAEGFIRNIGAIFDTSRLGYRSCLVAFRLREEGIDEAAASINAHPGVSHNYLRSYAFSRPSILDSCRPYNLWFTLAVPPESRLGLEATVATLARNARADAVRLFPALRVFKIGVRLDMEAVIPAKAGIQACSRRRSRKETGFRVKPGMTQRTGPMSLCIAPFERQLVRVLQVDLALVEEPFCKVARQCGLEVEAVLQCARELLQWGIMRRFAAILNHRRAGYAGNVMAVWSVPEEKVASVGAQMAQFRAVSHCYQRPVYPEWPFALFTMVHEKSREQCGETVEAISRETGIDDYAMLWTAREFKKVRLKYFTDDYAAWEEKILERRVRSSLTKFAAGSRDAGICHPEQSEG